MLFFRILNISFLMFINALHSFEFVNVKMFS